MSDPRWETAKQLFDSALALAPDQRDRFLDRSCMDDRELRCEVESLIAAYEEAENFIEAPAVQEALNLINETNALPAAGRRIGNYEIIRELGHGGMGVVYLAARADDQYKKQVAIKLVQRGLDNCFIIDRFLAERQILANLDHPNIARLIDGGAAEGGENQQGSPYLVMEYIEGLPIDEYSDQHKLSTVERLKLFRAVCSAVHYAHQNLVIHRDVKPSNILVTREGTPKLLDFGIAKILSPEYSDSPGAQTATAVRLMTPDYASPEQVRGETITTSSDTYSLGVLLYKLLTGHHPYRFKTTQPKEIERVVCEVKPDRPSTAISRVEEAGTPDGLGTVTVSPESVSATRDARPERLRRLLRGDLDNVVLMAMRKEPERRYRSVEQFSEDIGRYLDGLPVVATNDTFRYRTAKFVRRHRLGAAAAAVIVLSLLGGIIATAWQARAARREKARAQTINAFLEQMLSYSNPVVTLPGSSNRETTMTQVLDEAAKRLEGDEFAGQPEVKAELERIIANSYDYQGRYDLALEHIQEYVDLERGLNAENHPDTLAASSAWAGLLFTKGDFAGAEKIYRRVLPLMRNEHRKGNIKPAIMADAFNGFAYLRRTQGDSAEAEALFRETLALGPQMPKEQRYIIGLAQSTLASTIADQGRFQEALQTARDATEQFRQAGQTSTPDFGFALTVLGGFLSDERDFAAADSVLREAEAIFRQRLLPSHLWLGDNLRNQAISFYRQDRFAEAAERAAETQKIYQQSFGEHYDHYPTVLIIQGLILNKTGKPQEGEAILREAVRLRAERLPKDHFWVAFANGALGECLMTQNRFSEAEPLLSESYASLIKSLGLEDPRTGEALRRLIRLYQAWGKPDQSARYSSLLTRRAP